LKAFGASDQQRSASPRRFSKLRLNDDDEYTPFSVLLDAFDGNFC